MPDAFRAANAPTRDFLALCAQKDSLLRRCVRDLKLAGAGARYPPIALPRPVFARTASLTGLADDVLRLLDLLETMPDRFFEGSLEAYLAAQGNTAGRAAIIRRGCVGSFVKYGRADAFGEGESFRVIELNLGSEVGGLGVAKLNRGLMLEPQFAEFAEIHNLTHADPLEPLMTELRACARSVVGNDDPCVAFVEDALGPSAQGVAVVEDLTALGMNVTLCGLDQVGWKRGKIVIDGRLPVDLVLRSFVLEDLFGEGAGVGKIDMLAQAHKYGCTALFTGLDSTLHSAKATLGLLYEPRIWSGLAPWERDLVARRVPWTRLIGHASSVSRGERRALVDECVIQREKLLLKPSALCQGSGILLGADLAENDWRAALENPDRPDYVVQEIIVPDTEDIIDPDDGRVEAWDVNWGVYFNQAGYNGTWVRGRRSVEKGIIGMNAGTRPGCAFTYN